MAGGLMNRFVRLFLVVVLIAPGVAVAQDRISIYTTNYPLAYFAERIGGEVVGVQFPAPADVDPVFWQPGPENIGRYQEADLILLNGAGYDKWAQYAFLPTSRLVDTSAEFSDRYLTSQGVVATHSHGPEGDHSHRGTAWTTWLDFELAADQATAIRDALVSHRPDQQTTFDANLEALESDLHDLDDSLAGAVAELPDRALLASHPVYQYLEHRYGLEITSLVWEPGEDPGEEQWSLVSRLAEERGFDRMLWEGEPLPASVSRLEQLGIASIVFDPAGNVPDAGDWLALMRDNIRNIQ